MSKETISWLNQNVLRGFTDKRGHAWHYMKAEQGDESNHYPGAIPVADLYRRLFGWAAEPRTLMYPAPGHVEMLEIRTEDNDGAEQVTYLADPQVPEGFRRAEQVAWVRSDTGEVLGIHGPDYQGHQYAEWLVRNVETILSDDAQVASAGLLRGGAVAWVQVEMPESVSTPQGVTFRPFLMATTSFDGSIATTYKTGSTDTVCDNTRDRYLSEPGETFRVKHTSRSGLRIAEARDTLGILFRVAEDMKAEIAAMCALDVAEAQWSAFLDAHEGTSYEVLTGAKKGERKEGRALTLAESQRATLTKMWNHDDRVSPWRGTAYGVVQAVNTYVHHEQTVRNVNRAERNMTRAVEGKVADIDRATVAELFPVLGLDLKAFRKQLVGSATGSATGSAA